MLSKEELEKLYKSGLSMQEISKKKRWPYYTVKYWMEKHNIPRRSRSEVCHWTYWNQHNDGKFRSSFQSNRKLIVKELKRLYYEEGYSAREVGELLGRSHSSIYRFMGRHNLPRRSPAQTNNIAYERTRPSYCLKKHLTSKEEKLKISGVMLYWAEGDKNLTKLAKRRGATIDFANSDPKMIKLFLRFLREVCGVDEKRLRILLYCYGNQDIDALKKYWSKITNVPSNQFTKPYIRRDFLLGKAGKMNYGLVHIRYSDKKLFFTSQKLD